MEKDERAGAEQLLRESLRLFDSVDYEWAVAVCSSLLASVLVRSGDAADVDEASALLGRALSLHDRVGDRRGIAQSLEVLAEVALAKGAAATAGRFVGAAGLLRDRVDAAPTEVESRRLTDLATRLNRALGAAAADHELHAGRTMPATAVLELAGRLTSAAEAGGGPVELTARQLEVAALVAAGRTNRQIGKALGISEKTTEIHVHNLMSRLDVPSRAGIAAWAATRASARARRRGFPLWAGTAAARRHPVRPQHRGPDTSAHRPGEGHDMDEDKLNEMLGRFVGDLGATITAGGVVIGHRLGLYRALADGPSTADDLARRTGCDPRYVAEWLRGQGAGGYMTYDARPTPGR